MITTIILRNGYPIWHGSLKRAKRKVKPNDWLVLIYELNGSIVIEKEPATNIFNLY